MKAIRMETYGDAGVMKFTEGVPKHEPGTGQALVRIHAAGVNYVDTYQRRGLYTVTLPYVPGLEAAGTIESVGKNAAGLRPGDRVAFTGHPGSYSEFTAIDTDRLISLPAELYLRAGCRPSRSRA